MPLRPIALTVFFVVVLSACAGSSGQAATDQASEPEPTSVTTTSLSTTEVKSTLETQPTSTTESAPELSDEEAGAAVHTRWMTEANVVNELEPGDVDRRLSAASAANRANEVGMNWNGPTARSQVVSLSSWPLSVSAMAAVLLVPLRAMPMIGGVTFPSGSMLAPRWRAWLDSILEIPAITVQGSPGHWVEALM